MRLDLFLAGKFPEKSRAVWQKIIVAGDVSVNGRVETASKREVSDHDKISIHISEKSIETREFPILYEDENVVVIDKPAGVLTHSKGAINDEFTVADFVKLRSNLQERSLQDNNRFGIVHRLDRATSGVLIAAKNPDAMKRLQRQFSDRKAKKTYVAVVEKVPKNLRAKIDLPIARDPKHPSKFRVDPKGKPAITDYEVMKTLPDGRAIIELRPLTGRTHQLRVHLAYIGAPIVGDPVYGAGALQERSLQKGRMMLHARSLEITLPNGERKTFVSSLPPEFESLLQERSLQ